MCTFLCDFGVKIQIFPKCDIFADFRPLCKELVFANGNFFNSENGKEEMIIISKHQVLCLHIE